MSELSGREFAGREFAGQGSGSGPSASEPAAGRRLRELAERGGGELLGFALEDVELEATGTVASYRARIRWPYGVREELAGMEGERAWLYPQDPELPGLKELAYPQAAVEFCNAYEIFSGGVGAGSLKIQMVSYRPTRRAVIRLSDGRVSVYAKIYRPSALAEMEERQRILIEAGLPVAPIRAVDPRGVIVSAALPGIPLAGFLAVGRSPVEISTLLDLLARLPDELTWLTPRTSWADALPHYSSLLSGILPQAVGLLEEVKTAFDTHPYVSRTPEPVHGDFHPGQILISGDRISGLLDPDTAGPGRRVDDLATFLAHLVTLDYDPQAKPALHKLIADWVPHFDAKVDPVQLRVRTAAVVVSLALGPYSSGARDWRRQTVRMLKQAQALVRQV
ncbi:MAG: aminoglycoside phosphotransferase family protein [Propionibacteriaceae bacterium]|jgi:hypothetical protein|nr:aminoglycoside phosphotransferase family protein [Propionibacteriaceae bacterium]